MTANLLTPVSEMLKNIETMAKSHFEKNGIEAVAPFEVADESPESLKEASNILQQLLPLRQYIEKNETENAVKHAIIMTRHCAELEQALNTEDTEFTPDSQSSGN